MIMKSTGPKLVSSTNALDDIRTDEIRCCHFTLLELPLSSNYRCPAAAVSEDIILLFSEIHFPGEVEDKCS